MDIKECSVKMCEVEGCGRAVERRQYCGMHYRRVMKHGSVGSASPMLLPKVGECIVEGCNRAVEKAQHCGMHYQRIRNTGAVGSPLPTPITTGCIIEGCSGTHKARGFCCDHYALLLRTGSPTSNRRKRGTGTYMNGYFKTSTGGEHTLAHREVAEMALGKPLPAGAVMHHVNGIRDDNRPANLVICPNSAYHNLLHQRADALDACGNASWRRCKFCKQYDDPKNLFIDDRPEGAAYHRACSNVDAAKYRAAKKAKLLSQQP